MITNNDILQIFRCHIPTGTRIAVEDIHKLVESKWAMKSKGKNAWIITWEGSESEHNGRCKVVAILRPQFKKRSVAFLLPILFCSEYSYTLCEKMEFIPPKGRDPYFKEPYRDINPELWYGIIPKQYLSARQVNLLCEKSKKDCFET